MGTTFQWCPSRQIMNRAYFTIPDENLFDDTLLRHIGLWIDWGMAVIGIKGL